MTTIRRPCPQCDRGPRDQALAITTDDRGEVKHCFRCGYWCSEREIICPHHGCSLLMVITSDPSGTTGRCAAGHDIGGRRVPLPAPARAERPAEPLAWSTLADGIWSRTQGLRGTLGEVYLRHRGCMSPPSDSDLRYLPGDGKYPPSLCARITSAIGNRPQSLHFTRLAPDGKGKAGTDRDKSLLKGHRKAGGCIRLWPDDAVTYSLGIAEGIETALSLAHGHPPVWAAIDAGNLAAFPVLAGIETLVVAADHDDAGISAAAEVGRRWGAADKVVKIIIPEIAGTDINDTVAA